MVMVRESKRREENIVEREKGRRGEEVVWMLVESCFLQTHGRKIETGVVESPEAETSWL